MTTYQSISVIGQAVTRCGVRCEVNYFDRIVQFYNPQKGMTMEMYVEDAAEMLSKCNTAAEFWEKIEEGY